MLSRALRITGSQSYYDPWLLLPMSFDLFVKSLQQEPVLLLHWMAAVRMSAYFLINHFLTQFTIM